MGEAHHQGIYFLNDGPPDHNVCKYILIGWAKPINQSIFPYNVGPEDHNWEIYPLIYGPEDQYWVIYHST